MLQEETNVLSQGPLRNGGNELKADQRPNNYYKLIRGNDLRGQQSTEGPLPENCESFLPSFLPSSEV